MSEETKTVTDFASLVASLPEDQQKLVQGETAKLRNEAKNLRDRAKVLATYEERLKSELGIEALDDSTLEALLEAHKSKQTGGDAAAALKRQLEKEQAARIAAEGKLSQMTRANQEKVRNEAIMSGVGKLGVRPEATMAAVKLIAADSVLEGEEWLFGGESLDTYLTKWQGEHGYMLANPVQPGAGQQGTAKGRTDSVKGKFFTAADVDKMTPEQRLANKDAIRESVKRWT